MSFCDWCGQGKIVAYIATCNHSICKKDIEKIQKQIHFENKAIVCKAQSCGKQFSHAKFIKQEIKKGCKQISFEARAVSKRIMRSKIKQKIPLKLSLQQIQQKDKSLTQQQQINKKQKIPQQNINNQGKDKQKQQIINRLNSQIQQIKQSNSKQQFLYKQQIKQLSQKIEQYELKQKNFKRQINQQQLKNINKEKQICRLRKQLQIKNKDQGIKPKCIEETKVRREIANLKYQLTGEEYISMLIYILDPGNRKQRLQTKIKAKRRQIQLQDQKNERNGWNTYLPFKNPYPDNLKKFSRSPIYDPVHDDRDFSIRYLGEVQRQMQQEELIAEFELKLHRFKKRNQNNCNRSESQI